MDERRSSSAFSAIHEPALCHDAMVHGIRCLSSGTAVPKDDHLKERTRSHEYKFYWPKQLQQLRDARGITDEEILLELGEEVYPPSKTDRPKECLHSRRRRLQVRELSFSEMAVLKTIIGLYIDHMVENPGSFLQSIFAVVRIQSMVTSGIFHLRRQSDYTYIVMTNTVYPPVSHEVMYTFLLNGQNRPSPSAALYGAGTINDFKLDHELAMNPKERKVVLDQLERDIGVLQSLGLADYDILYVITKRKKAYIMQLPGAPYGPELDNSITVERRDTIPHRHDIAYGTIATPAQLIPVPFKNYEFMDRYDFDFLICLQ